MVFVDSNIFYNVSENLHLITSLVVSLFRIFKNISLPVSVGFFSHSSRIFTLDSILKKVFSKLVFSHTIKSLTSMAKTTNTLNSVGKTSHKGFSLKSRLQVKF